MQIKTIPCEVETSDGRLKGKTSVAPRNGEISIFIPDYEAFLCVPLDDITDDSRRLILNNVRRQP